MRNVFSVTCGFVRTPSAAADLADERTCLRYGFDGDNLADMESRIVINPDVCNGRPVVRGTRITVQTILEFLGAGDSVEEILEEYPSLTREDVLACVQYSSRLMGNHFTLEALV